jgi:hypothetical protein
MLARLSPREIIRRAEEFLQQRQREVPEPQLPDLGFAHGFGFANGGPGQPGPSQPPDPPADYATWRRGGAMPTTQEGIDRWLTELTLEELV